MRINFGNAFGIHEAALRVRSERALIISGNLANADTPNFKARDLDFQQALEASRGDRVGVPPLTLTRPSHINVNTGAASGDLKYRAPLQPSVDGNTVDPQAERAAFTDNALRFQATMEFIDGRIRGLRAAIRGEF